MTRVSDKSAPAAAVRAKAALAAADGFLTPGLVATERHIRELLGGDAPFIGELLTYAAGASGKRFRPKLTMLAAATCGVLPERVADIAAAIELIHLATLLHDDVIDESSTRRGRPAARRRFGNRLSILGGDYLITRVFQSLVTNVRDWRVFEIVLAAANRMVAGEFFEIWWENRLDLSEENYVQVITLKSAKLLEASCRAGAIAAGGGEIPSKALGEYGLNAGLSFQITDDWLDFTAGSDELGKETFADVRDGKVTLPIIYGLSTPYGRAITEAVEAIWDGAAEENALRELLGSSGALEMTRNTARRYAETGIKALTPVPPGEARDLLAALADWTWQRTY